jgi:hypothetical protein
MKSSKAAALEMHVANRLIINVSHFLTTMARRLSRSLHPVKG